jgi:rod shape-determining protein MreD
MNKLITQNISRFIFLLLLQVVVLNQFHFLKFINPMVYVLWVVLFPVRKDKTLILISSFLLGLSVDFFSDSGGIHAAALTFVAFIRLPILKAVLNKTDFDFILFNIRSISFLKAFIFIGNIVLFHHLIVFGLEYFSFNEFYEIIKKTIIASFTTTLIGVLGIILFTKKR